MGQIGALCAESFCERMISCANDVDTDLTCSLSDESIEKAVVLKMNRAFIEYMWKEHKHALLKYMDYGDSLIGST